MKLNNDCIRDTLLFLEEALPLGGHIRDNVICDNLSQYNHHDVMYTLQKLFEGKLIGGNESEAKHRAGTIKEITIRGHKLLENIKPQEAWDQVQNAAKKAGGFSIDALADVAKQIAIMYISKHIGL